MSGDDMVSGHAIQDGVGTRGIVADRSADRSTVGASGSRAEHQAVLAQLCVQLIHHDPRLDAGDPSHRIHFEELVKVLGRVDNEGSAHGLSGKTAPTASWQDRRLVLRRELDRPADVVVRLRDHDAERLDLIV